MVWSTIPLDTDLGKISQSEEVSHWISKVLVAGPSEEARRATGDGPGQGNKRFSARRKIEIILCLSRDLELLSRELGVTAAQFSKWREQFFSAGRVVL